jgi:EPS-associated MarR family transcriptional regulator
MASKHPQDVEDLHFRVLKLLQDHPDLSQRELAEQLGVSNGKLHYCLKALIDKGLVKLENFAQSKHRLGYSYLLTPAGISEKAGMTSRFLKRKIAEYEALRQEIAALQAEIAMDHPAQGSKHELDHPGDPLRRIGHPPLAPEPQELSQAVHPFDRGQEPVAADA